MAAKIFRLLFSPRALLSAVLACVFYAVIFLNATGFCYSQIRYVSDEEILAKVLNLDWKTNMERVARRNSHTRGSQLIEFLQKVPTFGRVDGRTMYFRSLFYKEKLIDTPRDIFRFIGIYEVVASLAFDSGVDNPRYFTWFRSFDRCGEATYATFSDDDDKLSDDEWNGQWRDAHIVGSSVIFSKNYRAGSENH